MFASHRSSVLTLVILARVLTLAGVLMALDLAPRSARTAQWMDQGERAAEMGDLAQAHRAYDRVLAMLGTQPAVYERLVQVSLSAGRDAAAWMYLAALADLEGWTPARRTQLAGILERAGDLEQAVLLRAWSTEPQNARVLRQLAGEQIARLEWEQAALTLTQLVTLQPGDTESLYRLGLVLAPQDQNAAAVYLGRAAQDPVWSVQVAAVQAALNNYLYVSQAQAHTQLGITLAGLEEWPFAEQALRVALATNSVNPVASAYLGFVRDQQGRDGLPDLETALAMSPNDPTIYYFLGLHWRRLEEHEAAYQAFEQGYTLAPDNPALAAEVGLSLQNLGDLAGAETWLRTAIEIAPSKVRWQTLLAVFYADTGYQLETVGLPFIEALSQTTPNDSEVRASLGWAYYQADRMAEAYEQLSRAVTLDPGNMRSRYYFGMVLERQGDLQGAYESFWTVARQAGAGSRYQVLAERSLQRLTADSTG